MDDSFLVCRVQRRRIWRAMFIASGRASPAPLSRRADSTASRSASVGPSPARGVGNAISVYEAVNRADVWMAGGQRGPSASWSTRARRSGSVSQASGRADGDVARSAESWARYTLAHASGAAGFHDLVSAEVRTSLSDHVLLRCRRASGECVL